jgi:hypothetical protein
MSEWWPYSLSDVLPFSARTYYRLFELYNTAIWPVQILTILLGLAILVLLRRLGPAQGRVISAILAACWLWVAWAFLLTRFATINWAALYFAAAFAAEALLLVLIGVAGGSICLPSDGRWVTRAGIGVFLFALVIQPLIGPLSGRLWSQMEIFGVAPDPTVVATLGLLIPSPHWSKWLLLAVPIMWCLVSGATLWAMESPEAPVMPLAAAVAIVAAGSATFSRHNRATPQAGGPRQ